MAIILETTLNPAIDYPWGGGFASTQIGHNPRETAAHSGKLPGTGSEGMA